MIYSSIGVSFLVVVVECGRGNVLISLRQLEIFFVSVFVSALLDQWVVDAGYVFAGSGAEVDDFQTEGAGIGVELSGDLNGEADFLHALEAARGGHLNDELSGATDRWGPVFHEAGVVAGIGEHGFDGFVGFEESPFDVVVNGDLGFAAPGVDDFFWEAVEAAE